MSTAPLCWGLCSTEGLGGSGEPPRRPADPSSVSLDPLPAAVAHHSLREASQEPVGKAAGFAPFYYTK